MSNIKVIRWLADAVLEFFLALPAIFGVKPAAKVEKQACEGEVMEFQVLPATPPYRVIKPGEVEIEGVLYRAVVIPPVEPIRTRQVPAATAPLVPPPASDASTDQTKVEFRTVFNAVSSDALYLALDDLAMKKVQAVGHVLVREITNGKQSIEGAKEYLKKYVIEFSALLTKLQLQTPQLLQGSDAAKVLGVARDAAEDIINNKPNRRDLWDRLERAIPGFVSPEKCPAANLGLDYAAARREVEAMATELKLHELCDPDDVPWGTIHRFASVLVDSDPMHRDEVRREANETLAAMAANLS